VPRNGSTAVLLALLAGLGCALYVPFLGNPTFFDDRWLFSGHRFFEYASSPLGLAPRQPAYFSLAVVQVLSGKMEAHRAVSLLFHIGCAWTLYALLRELQRWSGSSETPQARLVAFSGAGFILLHPVAVYAAGYLVQRSIVLATLFGLASLLVFLRGLREHRLSGALWAAGLFSLAVLSKEHALLLPAVAAVVGICFLRDELRFALRYVALYLAACAPAGILVVLMAKNIVGQRYEREFSDVAAQIAPAASAEILETPWLGSVVTQAGLFFRYLGVWLWPDPARMAIDLRVDFEAFWSPLVAVAAVLAFLAWATASLVLLGRRGRSAMVGLGMLWMWVLYLLEFSVIRFQEPFVLYRSYLWAPGVAIAAVPALARIPVRYLACASIAALLVLTWQAHDRLRSFSSGLALWEDAVAKLPAGAIPGGSRTLYNLGREYLYGGEPAKAIAVIDRCQREYPDAYHCLFARAAIHLALEEYAAAVPHLQAAIEAHPGDGLPRHHLGFALQQLGCPEEARTQYELAQKLGFLGAAERLKSMDSPGQGLLPPARSRARAQSFVCPPIRSAAPRRG
jgi:protein O-mannosyl-transferase